MWTYKGKHKAEFYKRVRIDGKDDLKHVNGWLCEFNNGHRSINLFIDSDKCNFTCGLTGMSVFNPFGYPPSKRTISMTIDLFINSAYPDAYCKYTLDGHTFDKQKEEYRAMMKERNVTNG